MINLDKIFISSGAFKTNSLSEILKICEQIKFFNVELSSNINYDATAIKLLKNYRTNKKFNYLIHNYFPHPKIPFVLNLASNKSSILDLSRDHCLNCIELCSELKIPFYSVHAGFCFNAKPENLGMKQVDLERIPILESKKYFTESIQILSDYALNSDVCIAIENNVIANFNSVNRKNELFLGITSDDLLEIKDKIECNNVYFLLDVGHCKVSANSLGFNANQFIKEISPYTIAVHLSENNGLEDNNIEISNKSWFWNPLNSYLNEKVHFILEVYNLSIKKLDMQIEVINNSLCFKETEALYEEKS